MTFEEDVVNLLPALETLVGQDLLERGVQGTSMPIHFSILPYERAKLGI
jgi:hypothetical protein